MCLPTAGEFEFLSGSSVSLRSSGGLGEKEESAAKLSVGAADENQADVTGFHAESTGFQAGATGFAPHWVMWGPPQSDFYCLPSIGSAQHFNRACRPCAHIWRPKGCSKGLRCTYCHLCGEDEWRAYKRIYTHLTWKPP